MDFTEFTNNYDDVVSAENSWGFLNTLVGAQAMRPHQRKTLGIDILYGVLSITPIANALKFGKMALSPLK
jgi:hypothetical protein